jgi:O-antigen ligase
MILPVYLYLIATTRNRLVKIGSYAALALGFVGLYFTYTRGSWLVGIGAVSVAVALNRRHYLKIIAPALAVAPLLAIFVLGVGQDPIMKARMENEDTMASRVGVAVTVMRMWRDHPLVGVGFFRYRFERENYVDPVEVPVFGTVRFTNFRHTSIHDIYLGPLAETGLVGTFLQLSIYLVIFKAFLTQYRNRRGPPHFRHFILPIFGGMLIGYLIGGIAIDYRFFSAVGVIFYSVAGIIYGYAGESMTPTVLGPEMDGAELDEEA